MQHFCHIAFFEVFVRKKRTHVLGGVLFGLERMRVEGGGSLHGLRRGRMGVLPRDCEDAEDFADKGLPWRKCERWDEACNNELGFLRGNRWVNASFCRLE